MLSNIHVCCYCGDKATVLDHVVPVSWFSKQGKRPSNKAYLSRDKVVGSCEDCNKHLYNFFLHSIASRAEYLSEKLAIKHKKLLSMPFWSDEELNTLSGRLQTQIRAKQACKSILMDRLRHLNTIKQLVDYLPEDYWAQYD